MRSEFRRILIGFAIFGVALALSMYTYLFSVRRTAQGFLNESLTLSLGNSSFADVQHLIQNYKPYISFDQGCDNQHCLIRFYVDNRWASILGLAQRTSFVETITITGGRVSSVLLGLRSGLAYSATVVENSTDSSVVPYTLEVKRSTSDSSYFSINATFSPSASDEDRRAAHQFDLSCLTKRRGCRDARLMLPHLRLVTSTKSNGGS